MRIIIEDVELIVRIVLGRKVIKIKSVRTQEVLKNLQGRSAILDVHAVDSDNKEVDIEIQRSDAGAGAKRQGISSRTRKEWQLDAKVNKLRYD